MEKISAVIITFNEERNIVRCLQSLQGIVDEIVVVDSGSTDCTEALCRPFGVRFILHPFEGHIQQKNFAVKQASTQYVLSLDADEALSPELQASLREEKNRLQADGYTFNRLAIYCGRKRIHYSGWYPDSKIRLWNRQKGKWDGINPHDYVVMEHHAHIQHLKGDLLHYSYTSISDHIERSNKYTNIMAEEYFRMGRRSSIPAILFKPLWRFMHDYFVKLGFMDGYYGFVICTVVAFSTFLKYVKLYQLYRGSK
ncbi:MAG: glycosyltransferase family 2 protein [Bacteroidales bacterium]|jgi:glycosyltransferase involved in cell wall biosynthesis|nr:glycosyltransferase family 2 protein [Bacteroidales bacterium]